MQEELYPPVGEPDHSEPDEATARPRLRDLEVEPEPPFLRAQKRVAVRSRSLPRKTATGLMWLGVILAVSCVGAFVFAAVYRYGEHSWRFRIESSDAIEISGLGNVSRAQVMEVMGGDIGRNIFFVPLEQRQKQLEQIPWVESASVMRFVPNRLKIEIRERTPVAFARVGARIYLIDAAGILMDLSTTGKKKYSFPVILGMNPGEPLSTRGPRMKIYNDVINQLDSSGGHYSQDLSEVDLSDPEDVKVVVSQPQGEVLVHLGSSDYLDRYKIFVAHVQEWRQQFARLESVDLRYDRQIVVNPDLQGTVKEAPLSLGATKAAMAAGVKPAALVSHQAMGPKVADASKPGAVTARGKKVRRVAVKRRAKSPQKKAEKTVAASPKGDSAIAATVAVKSGGKPSPSIKTGDHP